MRRREGGVPIPLVVVSTVGSAEGYRGAAAALACAAVGVDCAPLLVDLQGRLPRGTLLCSAPASNLEDALRRQLRAGGVAARGTLCFVAPRSEDADLDTAVAAVAIARRYGSPAVVSVPEDRLMTAMKDLPYATGVLLRADLGDGRPRLREAVRQLREHTVAVGVLERRLGWVTERRALFGNPPASAHDGLPHTLARRLLGSWAHRADGGVR